MDMGPSAHQASAAAALPDGGPAPHAPEPPAREGTFSAPVATAPGMVAGPPVERQQEPEPAQARSMLAAGDAAVSAAFAQEQRARAPPGAPAAADAMSEPGFAREGHGQQSDPDPFGMYPRRAADTGMAGAAPPAPAWPAAPAPLVAPAPGAADVAMPTAPPAPAWPATLPPQDTPAAALAAMQTPQDRPPFGTLPGGAAAPEQGRASPGGARAFAPPGFGAAPMGTGVALAAGAPTGIRPPPPGFGGPQPAAAAGRPGAVGPGGAAAGNGAAGAAQDAGAWGRHPGRVAELVGSLSGRSSRTESPAAGQAAGGGLFAGMGAPASGFPSFASDAALSTDGGGAAPRPLTRPPSAATLGAGLAQRPNPNSGWGLPGLAHTGAAPPSVLPPGSQLLGGGGGSLGPASHSREGAGPGGSFSSLFGRDMFAAQRAAPTPTSLSSAFPPAAAPSPGGLAPQLGPQAQRGGLGSYGAAGAQAGGASLLQGDMGAGRAGSGGFQGLGAGLGLGSLGGHVGQPPTAASRLGIRSEPRPFGGPASAAPLQEALQRAALQSAALQAGALQHAPGRPPAQGSGWSGGAGAGAGLGYGQGLSYEQQLALMHGSMVAPGDRAYGQPGNYEQSSALGGLSSLLGAYAQGQAAPASAGAQLAPTGLQSAYAQPQASAPASAGAQVAQAHVHERLAHLQRTYAQPQASAPTSAGAHFAQAHMHERLAHLQRAYMQPQASAPAPPGAHFAPGALASFYAQAGGGGGSAYGAQQGPAALDALGQMRQPPPGVSSYGTPYAGASPAAWGNLASLGSSMGGGEAGPHAGLQAAGACFGAAGPHVGGAAQPAAPAQPQAQQAAAPLSYADMDGLMRMQAAAMGGAAAQGIGSESGFGRGAGAEHQYMLAQADLQLLQRLQSSVQAQQAQGQTLMQGLGTGADPYCGAVPAGAGAAAGHPGGGNPGQGAAEGAGTSFSWLDAFATRPAQPAQQAAGAQPAHPYGG